MVLPASNRSKINVRIQKTPTVLVNQSSLAARKLSDLTDVDLSANVDGAILIYDESKDKFVSSILLEKQILNGGNF